jgi:hypothetical protein
MIECAPMIMFGPRSSFRPSPQGLPDDIAVGVERK